jgi:hypothetical protein
VQQWGIDVDRPVEAERAEIVSPEPPGVPTGEPLRGDWAQQWGMDMERPVEADLADVVSSEQPRSRSRPSSNLRRGTARRALARLV